MSFIPPFAVACGATLCRARPSASSWGHRKCGKPRRSNRREAGGCDRGEADESHPGVRGRMRRRGTADATSTRHRSRRAGLEPGRAMPATERPPRPPHLRLGRHRRADTLAPRSPEVATPPLPGTASRDATGHPTRLSFPGEDLLAWDPEAQAGQLHVPHRAEAVIPEALRPEPRDDADELCVGIEEDDRFDQRKILVRRELRTLISCG